MTNNKDYYDSILNAITFGQLFLTELEELKEHSTIFNQNLKFYSNKTISELENIVDLFFKPMEHNEKKDVVKLFDANLEILTELNNINTETKIQLLMLLKSNPNKLFSLLSDYNSNEYL